MNNPMETGVAAPYDNRHLDAAPRDNLAAAVAAPAPVGIVPQSFGTRRSGPIVGGQDIAGLIAVAVMILGPLLTGALRAV